MACHRSRHHAEFSRTLARVMGRPCFFPVPAFALKLLVGEMAEAAAPLEHAAGRRGGSADRLHLRTRKRWTGAPRPPRPLTPGLRSRRPPTSALSRRSSTSVPAENGQERQVIIPERLGWMSIVAVGLKKPRICCVTSETPVTPVHSKPPLPRCSGSSRSAGRRPSPGGPAGARLPSGNAPPRPRPRRGDHHFRTPEAGPGRSSTGRRRIPRLRGPGGTPRTAAGPTSSGPGAQLPPALEERGPDPLRPSAGATPRSLQPAPGVIIAAHRSNSARSAQSSR